MKEVMGGEGSGGGMGGEGSGGGMGWRGEWRRDGVERGVEEGWGGDGVEGDGVEESVGWDIPCQVYARFCMNDSNFTQTYFIS